MSWMNYDQEAAKKAGGGEYITESGAYVGTLSAKWVLSRNGTQGIEFSLACQNGKANYLSVWAFKANGEMIAGGFNLIQAMIGLLKLRGLGQFNADAEVHEFAGKQIGLVLRKVLYTKNNGGDGYKFEIVMPFSATTNKTLREALDNKPAETVDRVLATLKDKDDRGAARQPVQSCGAFDPGVPPADFDDEINF